jgi:hypothetical protein
MSGLHSWWRRLSSAFGQQGLLPQMSRRGLDRTVKSPNPRDRHHLLGPLRDHAIPEQLALMANPQGPIQRVFNYDLRRLDRLIDMVQLAVMGHGPMKGHEAGGLQTQNRFEPASGGPRPMQIGCLRGRHHKAPIVGGQIGGQELIRRVSR